MSFILGLLGSLFSGLFGGAQTLGSGLLSGGQAVLGGAQSFLSGGGGDLLGGLLPLLVGGGSAQPAPPQFFSPGLTGVTPGTQAFFAAPAGAEIRRTPQLLLAQQQAKQTAQLQKTFLQATIKPQLETLKKAAKKQTQQTQKQMKQFLNAQAQLQKLQAKGKLETNQAQKLLAIVQQGPPQLPAFSPAFLTPFQSFGVQVF